MQFSKSMLIAAVALVAPLAIHADSLNAPSTLSVGGLNFSNLTCTINNSGVNATPSLCSQISAVTITTPANGIQFTSGFFAAHGSFEDADLSYTVTSTSGGITDVGLSFTPVFMGEGVSSVTETIYGGPNDTQVGFLTVDCSKTACNDQTDEIVLSGSYTTLNISKDIQLNSETNQNGTSGTVQVSNIDQTFTTATPEPASLALVGAGLLAAGAIRRKMVKA